MQHAPPGKLADALAVRASAPSASPGYPPLAVLPLQAGGDAAAPHVARWKRLELGLGLELHVREDASPDVQELVRRIHAMCAAPVATSSPG